MFGKDFHIYFSMLILAIGIISCTSTNDTSPVKEIMTKNLNESSNFTEIFNDGWNINRDTFDQINKLLSPGDTIVEIGSGAGTKALTSLYRVYSIEDDPKWINYAEESHYIYAPLKPYNITEFPEHKMWYDADIIKASLPKKYDLILVDGPCTRDENTQRGGFYKFINLFNTSLPIIFDDVHRPDELKLANLVSELLKRPLNIIKAKQKSFAVMDRAK